MNTKHAWRATSKTETTRRVSCIGQYYFTCSGAASAKHRPIMFTFMQIAVRFFEEILTAALRDAHKGP
jgi:hypothetical protein